MLFGQNRAHQTPRCCPVGEDAHHVPYRDRLYAGAFLCSDVPGNCWTSASAGETPGRRRSQDVGQSVFQHLGSLGEVLPELYHHPVRLGRGHLPMIVLPAPSRTFVHCYAKPGLSCRSCGQRDPVRDLPSGPLVSPTPGKSIGLELASESSGNWPSWVCGGLRRPHWVRMRRINLETAIAGR